MIWDAVVGGGEKWREGVREGESGRINATGLKQESFYFLQYLIRWFIETVYPTIWKHSMCNRKLDLRILILLK